MELVRILYLLVSFLYIYTGVRVLVVDRNNKVNRIFLIMTVCLGVWSTSLFLLTFTTSLDNILIIKAFAKFANYVFYVTVLYLVTLAGGLSPKSRLFVLVISVVAAFLKLYYIVFRSQEFVSTFPDGLNISFLNLPEQGFLVQSFASKYIIVCLSIAFVVFIFRSAEYKIQNKINSLYIIIPVFSISLFTAGYLSVKELNMKTSNPYEYSVIVYFIPILIIYHLIVKSEFFIEKHIAYSVIRALELMQEAFLITSEDYIINKANEEVERMTGYYIHQLYGMDAKELFEGLDSDDVKLVCAEGEKRKITLSQTKIVDEKTNIAFRIICFRDIEEIKKMENELLTMNNVLEERVERRRVVLYTIQKQMEKEIDEKKRLEEELSRLVYYDMLTDLYNRVLFHEKLQKQIQYSRSDIAVVAMDIDNFKRINDTFGHNEGDRILIELADLIRSTLRIGEIAARLEGDEFLILWNKIYSDEDVKVRVMELQEVIKDNFFVRDFKIHLTVTIGAAVYSNELSASELIYNANVALYGAKLQGIAGFEIYSKVGRNYLLEKIKIRKEIERAIRQDEFELYYQPQVNIRTEQVNGTEALIRWNHPERGVVTPGKFIPQIENENLIIKLGEWVIKQACMQIRQWEDMGRTEFLPVSINLSMRHFETEDIVGFLKDALRRYKIEPQHIKLEITESFRSSELTTLQNVLAKISDEKISVSVDDFGTGYSSFHYLKHIKADILKIPREYINEIGESQKTEFIVSSMIELAHDLDMTVIAEGVETVKEKEFLEQLGCDIIQGYYYYRPMSKKHLESIL